MKIIFESRGKSFKHFVLAVLVVGSVLKPILAIPAILLWLETIEVNINKKG